MIAAGGSAMDIDNNGAASSASAAGAAGDDATDAVMVAPVTSLGPAPLPPPPTDPYKDYEERRARRELYFAVAVAMVVTVAVVVTVSVLATGGGGGGGGVRHGTPGPPTPAPTSAAPTEAPTTGLPTDDAQARLDHVRRVLGVNAYTAAYRQELPTSASELQTDASVAAPVELAAYWIVREDQLVNRANVARRLALATVYYENGGADWRNRTGWLGPETHHCDWFGVTCCRDPFQAVAPTCVAGQDPDAIVELNLSGNGATGQMTPIFALLTDLRTLDLSYNEFTGALPSSELGSLPTLLALYLQHNSFTGQLDDSLRASGTLQTLYVQRNSLTGTWPQAFCPLCHDCLGNVDAFGLDCDEVACNDDCCRTYARCYYD